MVINKITYTHTYQIGLSQWQKIGLEAEIDETDDRQSCLEILRWEAEKFHKQSNPQLYKNGNEAIVSMYEGEQKEKYGWSGAVTFDTKPLTINREYERKSIEIENVSSLEELAKHKDYCSKHPDLMPVYMSKMKQLTEKIKV